MLKSLRLLTLSRCGIISQGSQCPSILIPKATSSFEGTRSYAYKSSIALENLYPTSSLNIAKPPQIPENEEKKFSGFIPMDKLKITYSRSSGPGGMNVNCVNTKVDIRFHLDTATWIPPIIRSCMKAKLRTSISKDGFFIITSDRTRFQHFNQADALEKLREMIRSCEPVEAPEPTPETLEKLRRGREKSARERLREKRIRHSVKESRGASSGDF